jgi:signal transduction histidine kinase
LQEQVQEAIRDIRQLVYDLRPPALDQLGLATALRAYAAQNSSTETEICVEAPEVLPPLPAAIEVAIYRIALEAITNVLKHAHARRCLIKLAAGELICLTVQDDGRGLPEAVQMGVGLPSMRERAEELGGKFSLHSTLGTGATISACFSLSTMKKALENE